MQKCVFKDIYNLSLNNINEFEKFFLSKDFNFKKINEYSEIKIKILDYFKNKKIYKINTILNISEKMMIYTFVYNDKFFNCYLSVKNKNLKLCQEISGKKYSKFISESGRYKLTNNFKTFPINLGSLNKEVPIIKLAGNAKEYHIDKNATYHFVKANISKQDLKFIFKNKKSKLFIQGNFEDVNFDFKKDFNVINFSNGEVTLNKSRIFLYDNLVGSDLYHIINNADKVIAFHGMMTNLATIENNPVLDLFYCKINSISDFRRYKNALYEFKPKYNGYDFIVPSKNIQKTIRKMRFSLKKT